MKLKQNLHTVNKKTSKDLTNPAENKGFSTNSHKISTDRKPRVFGGSKGFELFMIYMCAFAKHNQWGIISVYQELIADKIGLTSRQVRRLIKFAEETGCIIYKSGKSSRDKSEFLITSKAKKLYNSLLKQKCPTNKLKLFNTTDKSIKIFNPEEEMKNFILTEEQKKQVKDEFKLSVREIMNQFARFMKFYEIKDRYKTMFEHFKQFVSGSIANKWAKRTIDWIKSHFARKKWRLEQEAIAKEAKIELDRRSGKSRLGIQTGMQALGSIGVGFIRGIKRFGENDYSPYTSIADTKKAIDDLCELKKLEEDTKLAEMLGITIKEFYQMQGAI